MMDQLDDFDHNMMDEASINCPDGSDQAMGNYNGHYNGNNNNNGQGYIGNSNNGHHY